MEGCVEGDDPGETPPPSAVAASTAAAPGSNSRRVTTRAGTGTAASLAGMVAARSSGAADGISPVHGAYGLAIEEEVEDLLSSHMKFMQGRSSPSNGSGSSQRSGLGGKSVSYRGGASSKPMDARQGEMPIALVAIVTFDLRQGPCLVCVDPPIEDEQGQPTLPLSTADIHVLRSDMPFKALPENGLAAAELSQGPSRTAPSENEGGIWAWAKGWVMPSGEGGGAHGRDSGRGGDARGGGVGGSQQHHGHCLFMLRVSGENLFGMSHFLRVEDPDSPRGYTQGAAVCLSRLPFFGLVLQRLHAFSMDVIDRSGCAGQLAALAADLRETRFEDLGHSSVYQDLPVPTVLLKLRSKLLAVLRLLLLEGRVLFCAKSAATVSEAVMAVASLLPGSLPLGLGRLDPPGFGLKAYRWRKHGFPLKLFRKEAPLEPLVVIAGAADVLAKDGFFAGTTNTMMQVMPNANLDLLLNVDTWEARWGKTERAKAALDMGEPDRSFARELVRATKRHLGGGVGGDGSMEGVGWQGSSAWIADQFQLHFEDLVTTAAECLARNASLEEARRREEEEEEQRRKAALEDGGRGSAMKMIAGVVTPTLDGIGLNKAWQQTATWLNGSGPVPVAAALESHGQRWSELWTESENFGVWQSSHRLAGANGNPSEALPPSSSLRSEPGDGGNSNSNSNSDPNKAALGPPTTAKFSNSSGSGSTLANALLCSNGLAGAGAFFIDDVRSSSSSSAKKAGSEGAPRSGVKTYTYENSGDTYTGSWQNGRRHGVGVYEERATGNSYEGDWVEDARHGRGVLTSGDKDFVYDGEWVDDKRTGVGNSVIRGTETYSGRWKDGEFHGGGVHCDARGNVYDGEFVHGQREGVGRWTAKSGLEYVGEWRAGQMSGVGQSTEKDGTAYSGEWHNGRYSGEGTLTLPTGARYEGMFREGEKHGSGSLLTAEGDTLEGEWVKSRPQEGDTEWRIRFANGDHFAGTVLEGVPHGTGTYKYSNGDIFTGGWDRGLRHGQGICVFANGEKFEGEWVRDHISYQGKGALTLADGTTHDFA